MRNLYPFLMYLLHILASVSIETAGLKPFSKQKALVQVFLHKFRVAPSLKLYYQEKNQLIAIRVFKIFTLFLFSLLWYQVYSNGIPGNIFFMHFNLTDQAKKSRLTFNSSSRKIFEYVFQWFFRNKLYRRSKLKLITVKQKRFKLKLAVKTG